MGIASNFAALNALIRGPLCPLTPRPGPGPGPGPVPPRSPQVEYFGAPTPLKQMGAITVPDAQTLMIAPFDRSTIKDIERAIQESDIGINPNNDGERIRLIMPAMTQVRGARTAPVRRLCRRPCGAPQPGSLCMAPLL
jgi:hypothetical protein